ncbi:MAG: hypothetical protein IPI50_02040 [Saprospiraceae bacterium]|nr:hypothetical protein [Saprospiraceae bacterium]
MKGFSIIFSFYLFALAILPCRDSDDCNYQGSEQSIVDTKHHSEQESHSDHCSPLCVCACCGQTTIICFYPTAFYNPPTLIKQGDPIYNASFFLEVYLPIWQPPKIS